jgi:hypothetical protein
MQGQVHLAHLADVGCAGKVRGGLGKDRGLPVRYGHCRGFLLLLLLLLLFLRLLVGTGFIGFLCDILSLEQLFDVLVTKGPLRFILVYMFSQVSTSVPFLDLRNVQLCVLFSGPPGADVWYSPVIFGFQQ